MGIQAPPNGTHGVKLAGGRLLWKLLKPLERMQIQGAERMEALKQIAAISPRYGKC